MAGTREYLRYVMKSIRNTEARMMLDGLPLKSPALNELAEQNSASKSGRSRCASVFLENSKMMGVMTLDAADVSLAQDASGFTDARWGIIYDDGSSNKLAIAFLDLGGDTSIADASLDITWNASGILTLDQA